MHTVSQLGHYQPSPYIPVQSRLTNPGHWPVPLRDRTGYNCVREQKVNASLGRETLSYGAVSDSTMCVSGEIAQTMIV